MSGEEPILGHVFIVTPTRRRSCAGQEAACLQLETKSRLWRRWRWQCSCGATEGGYFLKASAVFHGDNHTMRAA